MRDGAETPLDRALRIDTTVMLVDDPVKRVDNMTMAWGLEARVPFLDQELVELAATMPPGLKLAGRGKKRTTVTDNILGDACEAVIGAIYLDGGLEAATAFIKANWKELLDKAPEARKVYGPAAVPKVIAGVRSVGALGRPVPPPPEDAIAAGPVRAAFITTREK